MTKNAFDKIKAGLDDALADQLDMDGLERVCPWNTNHAGYRDIFNAAVTGILANPAFFGPVFQGEPEAAVDFADLVVVAAINRETP